VKARAPPVQRSLLRRADVSSSLRKGELVRISFERSTLGGAAVWPDGKVVRYRAELDDRILQLLSVSVCSSDPTCGLPP
jgi:hypothetical protein